MERVMYIMEIKCFRKKIFVLISKIKIWVGQNVFEEVMRLNSPLL